MGENTKRVIETATKTTLNEGIAKREEEKDVSLKK